MLKHEAQAMAGGQIPLVLDELTDVAGTDSTEDAVDTSILAGHINGFLAGLDKDQRIVFVRRYFYIDSLADIAKQISMSEPAVKSLLYRLRQRLKEFLEKEGYEL